jgi:hypothetical protein
MSVEVVLALFFLSGMARLGSAQLSRRELSVRLLHRLTALADGKEKSFERPRSGKVWESVGEKRGTDLTWCKMQIRVRVTEALP